MACGFYGVLLYQNFVTDRAVLALGQTGFGTGRCYHLVNDFGMSVGLDRFLLYENRVTDRAMFARSLAVCGACSRYRCIGDLGMTAGGDGQLALAYYVLAVFIGIVCFTSSAVPVFLCTSLYTGRLDFCMVC